MDSPELTTVGILGGGQLAQMICQRAPAVGVNTLVYVANGAEPAAQSGSSFVVGDWTTTAALESFLSQSQIVIFENEFIPCDVLEVAAQNIKNRGGPSPSFRPWLNALAQIQNKLTQKKILEHLAIDTSAYDACPVTNATDTLAMEQWIQAMILKYHGACVFKWAKFGYDGKGTWICPGTKTLTPTELGALVAFCCQGLQRGGALYVECKIEFRRELAIVACSSQNGEFKTYPLVISQQEAGICRLVTGPAVALGTPSSLEAQAQRAAQKLAQALNLVGTFAIEFFETTQGQLLVNEIAPRVHNSGHYSQEAAPCSQFENHLRGVLGLPLGDTNCSAGFAMLNLIGNASIGTRQLSNYEPPKVPSLLQGDGYQYKVHWYGKHEIRNGRKMGHINGVCAQASEVGALVKNLESYEKLWNQSFG